MFDLDSLPVRLLDRVVLRFVRRLVVSLVRKSCYEMKETVLPRFTHNWEKRLSPDKFIRQCGAGNVRMAKNDKGY